MNHNGNAIESRLWAAADELRANSKLKSSEYSVPVLGLVFLRYADHKYQEAAKELTSDRGGGRRKIGPADYQARGVLYLPEAARFSTLIALPEGANIGAAINEAMRAIEAENPDFKDVLPKAYNRFENPLLKELLKAMNSVPMDIEEIKPARIEMFQYELMTKPREGKKKAYKPATVNRMLALMKRIYNPAIREEMVERNSCFKVTMLPENNKCDRVITHAEFDAIVSYLPKHAADIVTTAYNTGMRAGEIFNLTWNRVNTKEGSIELTIADTKNAEPRRIYFNDDLKALLRHQITQVLLQALPEV